MSKVIVSDVFGPHFDEDLIYSIFENEFNEGISNKKEISNGINGDYELFTFIFEHKDNVYSIDFKKHTSPNVFDFEFNFDTFYLLGNAKELQMGIEKQEVELLKNRHESKVKQLEKRIDELETQNSELEDIIHDANDLKKGELKYASKAIYALSEGLAKEEGAKYKKASSILYSVSKLVKAIAEFK